MYILVICNFYVNRGMAHRSHSALAVWIYQNETQRVFQTIQASFSWSKHPGFLDNQVAWLIQTQSTLVIHHQSTLVKHPSLHPDHYVGKAWLLPIQSALVTSDTKRPGYFRYKAPWLLPIQSALVIWAPHGMGGYMTQCCTKGAPHKCNVVACKQNQYERLVTWVAEGEQGAAL